METLVNNTCKKEGENNKLDISSPSYEEIEQKQTSFAIKFGLILFLSLALFFAFGIVLFSGTGSAVGTYPAVDPNMVLYYHFNNQSAYGENDTHVYDFSGNGNNGTVVGAIHNATGGYLGDGDFIFNASSSHKIFAPYSQSFNITNLTGITVSAWINPQNLVLNDGDIVNRYVAQAGNRTWLLGILDNKLRFNLCTDGISCVSETGSTTIGSNSGWWWVVGVWNGTEIRVYVNGAVDGGVGSAVSQIVDSQTIFEVGRDRFSQVFNGSIDEVIFWNRSLTDREIWDTYTKYIACLDVRESQKIAGDVTWCGSSYSVNGSLSTVGGVQIIASDLTIDANGSTLFGNVTDKTNKNLFGIIANSGYSNITIKNLIMRDYDRALYFKNSSQITLLNSSISNSRISFIVDDIASDIYVYNNTLINNSYNVYLNNVSGGKVEGNYFFDTDFYTIVTDANKYLKYINISRNTFHNDSAQMTGVTASNWTNINIYNNSWTNVYIALALTGTDSISFYNNHVLNCSGNFCVGGRNSTNFNVYNNDIDTGDRPIIIYGVGNNINIYNNTVRNALTHTDSFDNAIHIATEFRNSTLRISNVHIYNNTLIDFGCSGILARDLNYSTIEGNIFSQNYTYLLTKNFNCNNEPLTGIFIQQSYKGFIPVGTNSGDGYSITSLHQSDNIIIQNNVFNNIQVPLKIQGVYTNISHDLDDFWFRKYQLSYFSDPEELYISNNFNNLTTMKTAGSFVDFLRQGINGNFSLNLKQFKDYEHYNNSASFQIVNQVFNKSNALFHNSTSICNGSSTNINSNTGNINITLNPNQFCYVLDNFNLTEGVNREYSPIWISSSGNTKTVTNTLTTNLNVSTTLNLKTFSSCSEIKSLAINGIEKDYTCDETNIFFIYDYPAGSTNILVDYYSVDPEVCGQGSTAFAMMIIPLGLVLTIIVLGFVLFLVFGVFKGQSIDWKELGIITGILTVAGLFILVITVMVLLNSLCINL